MSLHNEAADAPASPGAALDQFLVAAEKEGEAGLEESRFRALAASLRTAVSSVYASSPSSGQAVLERVVDLCGEENTNTVIRDEVHRLTGRLLADLAPDIQAQFVSVCLQRLHQDLSGARNTRTWRPLAYVLAANYSLIKSRELRRQLIDKLKLLTTENPNYENDFFIEDLLLIHDKVRLERLEEIKEMLESGESGEKKA